MVDEMQRLLEHFRSLYESKLSAVDEKENELSREEILQMKLDILQSYATDVAEQNLHLVHAAQLLQTEAGARVAILDKLLDRTSLTSKDYMQKINEYQEDLGGSFDSKTSLYKAVEAKLEKLESERDSVREHAAYLGRQVATLIHVISQARTTCYLDFSNSEVNVDESEVFSPVEKFHSLNKGLRNHDESCISSSENCVTLSNSFSQDNLRSETPSILSESCNCTQTSKDKYGESVTNKDVVIRRLQVDFRVLEKELNNKTTQLLAKDRSIANLQSQITELRHELSLKEAECAVHLHSLQKKIDDKRIVHLQQPRVEELDKPKRIEPVTLCQVTQTEARMAESREKRELEMKALHACISEKQAEIELLRQAIDSMKADSETSLQNLSEKCKMQMKEVQHELDTHKTEKIKFKEELQHSETAAQETRLILTKEIAERHDIIKSLRDELAEQAEHHKEIVQQLVLKSEVIKGLRKSLKNVETKLESNEMELSRAKEELLRYQNTVDTQSNELENQKITITNLQDALVQSKRIAVGGSSPANGTSSKPRTTAGREVFHI